jgi:hypothetical protein
MKPLQPSAPQTVAKAAIVRLVEPIGNCYLRTSFNSLITDEKAKFQFLTNNPRDGLAVWLATVVHKTS